MKEFHVEEVVGRLDAIGEAELDVLPIGMIELDREGRILRSNRTEGELARRDPQKQLGKSAREGVGSPRPARAPPRARPGDPRGRARRVHGHPPVGP